jgi:acetyl-CoA carboxylase biotin carboxyl carrier protein
MNLNELRDIIRIFDASSLSELEIEEKGTRFRLVKNVMETEKPPEEGMSISETVIEQHLEGDQMRGLKVLVKSPLVGTFYRASAPEAEPFVEIGQHIHPGQTLCIIEAMKVMNEITSEVTGTVKEILVENAHPIEYDQELFVIEREE